MGTVTGPHLSHKKRRNARLSHGSSKNHFTLWSGAGEPPGGLVTHSPHILAGTASQLPLLQLRTGQPYPQPLPGFPSASLNLGFQGHLLSPCPSLWGLHTALTQSERSTIIKTRQHLTLTQTKEARLRRPRHSAAQRDTQRLTMHRGARVPLHPGKICKMPKGLFF